MPTRRVRDRDERDRDKKFHATFPATFLSCNLPSETETRERERDISECGREKDDGEVLLRTGTLQAS